MITTSFKLIAAILILLAGIVGGFLPLLSTHKKLSQRLLYYGEYFSRGIFLSAALIHLLPDSVSMMKQSLTHTSYPLAFCIMAFAFFSIKLIENSGHWLAEKINFSKNWMPYLLLILLSIHSVITGATLGISTSSEQIIILFIAIIAHKSSAAFALSINMLKHRLNHRSIILLIGLFSLMTPIGIVVSSLMYMMLHTNAAPIAQGIFASIAAGTFLYIATFKGERTESDTKPTSSLLPTLYFGLGIMLMAVVAFWL